MVVSQQASKLVQILDIVVIVEFAFYLLRCIDSLQKAWFPPIAQKHASKVASIGASVSGWLQETTPLKTAGIDTRFWEQLEHLQKLKVDEMS